VIKGDKNTLARQIRSLQSEGVVIVDTPPNNREILMMVGMVSDILIVPVSPSGIDIDRLVNTLSVLDNVQAARGEMTQAVLLTKYAKRRKLSQEAEAALSVLSIFDSKIRDLERYEAFGGVPKYLEEYGAAWQEVKGVLHGD
jgi:chromosome partitioning protein